MSRLIAPFPYRARRGGALVEGALVLTMVLLTLIGIVDVGQVLLTYQALVERLSAGARWGVVNTYDVDKIRNVVIYNTPNPVAGAKPILGLSSEMVQVTLIGAGDPEAVIEVRIVNYPFRFFTPFIKGIYQAQRLRISMPVEGQGVTSLEAPPSLAVTQIHQPR